jgi:hypothetical protein
VIAWMIVSVLVGVGMTSMDVYVRRTRLTAQWFAPVHVARVEIGLHRALHGEGPAFADIDAVREHWPIRSEPVDMQVQDGSFNVRAVMPGGAVNVSWLLVRPKGDATLFWTCGYAPLPELAPSSSLPNLTDAPPSWLPANCRPVQ